MEKEIKAEVFARKPFFGLNLPIFAQIQMIIIFMVVSLAVLGFTTLNIINTMKDNSLWLASNKFDFKKMISLYEDLYLRMTYTK